VEGREHKDAQTELYLESLTEQVDETSIGCQTDAFLDRVGSPYFKQQKTGVDAETQIEEHDVRSSFICTCYFISRPTRASDCIICIMTFLAGGRVC